MALNNITGNLFEYQNEKRFSFNRIINEDCLEYLDKIPRHVKFDLVIADPPYNIRKNFGNNSDDRTLHEYITWSETWIKKRLSLLKEDGLIYIYGFSEILAYISVKFPLENQKWLVWRYTNKTVPSLKFWQRSHETILSLWKNKRPNLEIDKIREPYTETYNTDKKTDTFANQKPKRKPFNSICRIWLGVCFSKVFGDQLFGNRNKSGICFFCKSVAGKRLG